MKLLFALLSVVNIIFVAGVYVCKAALDEFDNL